MPEIIINFLLISLVIIGIITLVIWFAKNYAIVLVKGTSMHPTLKDGEIVLIKKRFILKEKGIYIFFREGKYIIKRLDKIIYEVGKEPKLFVLGDNLDSSLDSRDYGLLNINSVKGQVIKKLFKI